MHWDNEISHNNLPEAIAFLIAKMTSLEKTIEELKNVRKDLSQNELLTRQEAADYLKCDISTIDLWSKKGKLKRQGLGHRVYYKRSDVEEALVTLKR